MIRKTKAYKVGKLAPAALIGYGFLLESEIACASVVFCTFGTVCVAECIISKIERRHQRIDKGDQSSTTLS